MGVLSVAAMLGLIGGLALGSRQSATAQPSTPTVVVVPGATPSGSSTSSNTSAATPSPAPAPSPPATNSGGS